MSFKLNEIWKIIKNWSQVIENKSFGDQRCGVEFNPVQHKCSTFESNEYSLTANEWLGMDVVCWLAELSANWFVFFALKKLQINQIDIYHGNQNKSQLHFADVSFEYSKIESPDTDCLQFFSNWLFLNCTVVWCSQTEVRNGTEDGHNIVVPINSVKCK